MDKSEEEILKEMRRKANIGKYRQDGTLYPDTEEGLFEWARDFEDIKNRRVAQTFLWNGLEVSTVWLGLDHNFGCPGQPLIYESMVFSPGGIWSRTDLDQWRYPDRLTATEGHARLVKKWGHPYWLAHTLLHRAYYSITDSIGRLWNKGRAFLGRGKNGRPGIR